MAAYNAKRTGMFKLLEKQATVVLALLSVGIVLVSHIMLLVTPDQCSEETIRAVSIMNIAASAVLTVLVFYPFMFVMFRGF